MRATIKLKLGLTFAAIVLLAAAMAWLGISNLASLNTSLDGVVEGPVQRLRMASDLYSRLLMIVRAEKNLIMSEAPDEVAKYDAEVVKERAQFVSDRDKLEAIADAEGRQRLVAISGAWQQLIAVEDKIRDLVRHDGLEEAKRLSRTDGRQAVGKMRMA